MKRVYWHILCGILISLYFVACNDKTKEEVIEDVPNMPLILKGDDTLDELMDKIFAHYVLKTHQTKQHSQTENQNKLLSIQNKQNQIYELLKEAYAQNKTYKIKNATLERALVLTQEWSLLCGLAKPCAELEATEYYDVNIALALSLLFLNHSNDDSNILNTLLLGQYRGAQKNGNLNMIIETQIQVRLLALFGLYHLDSTTHNTRNSLDYKIHMNLESDLEQYMGFLSGEHFAVYQKTFHLLKNDLLKQQAPMDVIFTQLLSYPQSLNLFLAENNVYLHIDRIKQAYELFKIQDFDAQIARDIIQIANDPLKNIYHDLLMGHYLYGLDYLSLAFLNYEVNINLPLAIEFLQKDFKTLQISQHRFEKVLFKNYIASLFMGAYILSQTYTDEAYFDELLRIIKAELSQYKDMITHQEMDLYKDAIFILEQTDRDNFLALKFLKSSSEDEEGYVKVKLALSPQEVIQLKGIVSKEQTAFKENRKVCLSPLEVNFMLSLAYQAYKIYGFKSVPPEMFYIRLYEVLGIKQSEQTDLFKFLSDFDSFILLDLADNQCYRQNSLMDLALNTSKEEQSICGYNLYFNKENVFVIDSIFPSEVLEQSHDGAIYYRIKKVNINLNEFIFSNDENALRELKQAEDKGEILSILLTYFPNMKKYLSYRLLPHEAEDLITKVESKACGLK